MKSLLKVLMVGIYISAFLLLAHANQRNLHTIERYQEITRTMQEVLDREHITVLKIRPLTPEEIKTYESLTNTETAPDSFYKPGPETTQCWVGRNDGDNVCYEHGPCTDPDSGDELY